MRIPALSPRDRRAVVAGLLLVAPALAWSRGALPWLRAVGDAREALAAERALLDRELRLLAGAERYPAAFQVGAERLLAEAPRLVGGADDGAASAALSGYVRTAAQEARVHLTRVEPAPSTDAGAGITALPLEVRGESDLEGILTLLHLLETGPKLVHVTALALEAPERRAAAAPDPYGAFYAPVAPAAEAIALRLRVTGFTLSDRAAAAGGGR
jgi:hypothetical protein